MARQEELFMNTITGMKRALLREGDDSESDSSISRATNRGNKLKRRARYVSEARLDIANSTKANRRRINYNGYFRDIIYKKPNMIDADGDIVLESDELVEKDFDVAYADPYAGVKIEDLLLPLTSAAGLKDHPTLSFPYSTKALDEILESAQDMVRREQDALWRMKELFSGFGGDSAWMPIGDFETSNDISLIIANTSMNQLSESSPRDITDLEVAACGLATVTRSSQISKQASERPDGTTDSLGEGELTRHVQAKDYGAPRQILSQFDSRTDRTSPVTENLPSLMSSKDVREQIGDGMSVEALSATNSTVEGTKTWRDHRSLVDGGEYSSSGGGRSINSILPSTEATTGAVYGEDVRGPSQLRPEVNDEESTEGDSIKTAHRMTTRAKAQAAPSPSSSRHSSPAMTRVHPFFLVPAKCLSANDMGLPYEEADETRRLMGAYIQKQEEVVRSSWKMYSGLLKARRLRENVLEWCTAEGHVGEMDDGEDWCDITRWGLQEGELLKGKEEEEEEINVVGGKKTRNRRAAAN